MSSQRNRSGRGSNRNNGGDVGEEVDLWKTCQAGLHNIVDMYNEHSDNAQKIHDLDKIVASNRRANSQGFHESRNQLEAAVRAGVKITERDRLSNQSSQLKDLIEHLEVLRGVQYADGRAADQAGPPPMSSGRGGSSRNRDPAATAPTSKELYDMFDDTDGPVPSPLAHGGGPSSRKDRSATRDSVPPRGDRGTPSKADSLEPQLPLGSGDGGVRSSGAGGTSGPGSTGSGAGSGAARSKITFFKDDEVAFKAKVADSGEAYWILGVVQLVIGEGKSRRYRVLDPEPDEATGKQKDYKTSASNMIPITPAAQIANLPQWERGRTVLALYPGTTTFYKAEVISTEPDGRVNLRFEGEENATTMQAVERRYVVEFRG